MLRSLPMSRNTVRMVAELAAVWAAGLALFVAVVR